MLKPNHLGKVQKRDGSIVPFNPAKIQNAIFRAALEVLQNSGEASSVSSRVTPVVAQKLKKDFGRKPLQVEAIQDTVETALMEAGYQPDRQELHPLPGAAQRTPPGKIGPGDQRRSQASLQHHGGSEKEISSEGRPAKHHRNPERTLPARGRACRPGREGLQILPVTPGGGGKILPDDAEPGVPAQLPYPDERRDLFGPAFRLFRHSGGGLHRRHLSKP